MISLSNELLSVSIALHGAEIREVFDKRLDSNRMWNGDSEYWGRVSPVLFPIVGRVKGGKFIVDEQTYTLSQHGYLRDQDFECVEHTDTSATFLFQSLGKYQEAYPYEHEVRITYKLEGDVVSVIWDVKNIDTRTMYYSMGAHPAFLLDPKGNYVFQLSGKQGSKFITLKEGYVDAFNDYDMSEPISVTYENFKNDARIYSDIDKVTLINKAGVDRVTLTCPGFDYVGLWSATQHGHMPPFVCIEPWLGITDTVQNGVNFKEKLGIKSLEPNNNNESIYRIQFGIQ